VAWGRDKERRRQAVRKKNGRETGGLEN